MLLDEESIVAWRPNNHEWNKRTCPRSTVRFYSCESCDVYIYIDYSSCILHTAGCVCICICIWVQVQVSYCTLDTVSRWVRCNPIYRFRSTASEQSTLCRHSASSALPIHRRRLQSGCSVCGSGVTCEAHFSDSNSNGYMTMHCLVPVSFIISANAASW